MSTYCTTAKPIVNLLYSFDAVLPVFPKDICVARCFSNRKKIFNINKLNNSNQILPVKGVAWHTHCYSESALQQKQDFGAEYTANIPFA
jgi:hypothetical protein